MSTASRRKNGARRPIVDELLAWAEDYPIQWREPSLDLGELAKLRWIRGLTRREIAERFGRSQGGIQHYFDQMNQLGSEISGLSSDERRRVKRALDQAGASGAPAGRIPARPPKRARC